ncbi:MAG: hypothetical protein OZSIB_2688 [Candidatus Ozemobacter sibiricus]|jgi:hypothetical protein|uniref:Uncharacterized protein n=1 Tax=Candidatus Ozemobacter sibiricus TaxID=2268124 RepID=A0A367ZRY8_9BACT|nr:MAG: hypothetical protein OZSIB_2688 [Candidatus Ozemobacter sibiricus]
MTSLMKEIRDEFLSEEDLDLASLTLEELERVWQEWLRQAQASNDLDAWVYSHGVFAGADLRELFPDLATPRPNKRPGGD